MHYARVPLILISCSINFDGVVGYGEGVVYLMSLGHQMILVYSWARPVIIVAGKGRGGKFLFLHFHSCYSFFSGR